MPPKFHCCPLAERGLAEVQDVAFLLGLPVPEVTPEEEAQHLGHRKDLVHIKQAGDAKAIAKELDARVRRARSTAKQLRCQAESLDLQHRFAAEYAARAAGAAAQIEGLLAQVPAPEPRP